MSNNKSHTAWRNAEDPRWPISGLYWFYGSFFVIFFWTLEADHKWVSSVCHIVWHDTHVSVSSLCPAQRSEFMPIEFKSGLMIALGFFCHFVQSESVTLFLTLLAILKIRITFWDFHLFSCLFVRMWFFCLFCSATGLCLQYTKLGPLKDEILVQLDPKIDSKGQGCTRPRNLHYPLEVKNNNKSFKSCCTMGWNQLQTHGTNSLKWM